MSTSMGGFTGLRGSTGAPSSQNTGYNLVNTLSPEKKQLFEMLLSGGGQGVQGGLSQLSQSAQGGSPEYWRQQEAPALRQFGELQAQNASRFSGIGLGSRRSSGFANYTGGQAAGLAEKLQSNRMSLQQQAIQDLLGLSKSLLGMDDTALIEKERKNPWGSALTGATSGATAGSAFGPWGTGIGAAIGGIGGYFAGR